MVKKVNTSARKETIGKKESAKLLDQEKELLKNVGKRLKEFRLKAGYSNYEHFAYDHGISRPQYGKYEAGANITLSTLVRILKALDVSLGEFFGDFK